MERTPKHGKKGTLVLGWPYAFKKIIHAMPLGSTMDNDELVRLAADLLDSTAPFDKSRLRVLVEYRRAGVIEYHMASSGVKIKAITKLQPITIKERNQLTAVGLRRYFSDQIGRHGVTGGPAMKEFYYYIRRYVTRRVRASAGRGYAEVSVPERVATVCLLVDDSGTVCRGVAVCSPKDQFCKKTGRGYARARALSAQRQKFTFGLLPWYWDSRPTNTYKKGTYNAILNQREVEILENQFYRRTDNDFARNNNLPPTEWDGLQAHEGAPMEC